MRHYEILLMIHPDQGGQINAMIDRYTLMVTKGGGKVHRQEDWGKLQLAYQINKLYKANYVLLNIECSQASIAELCNSFKFNDAIIRHLILKCDSAITEPSAFLKNRENEKNNYKDNSGYNNTKDYRDTADNLVKQPRHEEISEVSNKEVQDNTDTDTVVN